MDIAVDTSVIIAVIANEPVKGQLIALTQSADLIAPASVHWEMGNAFSAMLKRNRITLHLALQAMDIYRRIPLRFVEVELSEALKTAAELGIYAYDAYLIQCALKYNVPLLTLDQSLAQRAREKGAQIIEVK
ncbi:MAG: type II toxin-antitoxin system VapC family toxin [Anaerolineae bacterium]|nr:type II toxin-antitoxin system VapC family toxin [Anaerolineae bacterium]